MLSPNKVALLDAINDNQPITYQEWNHRVNRLANFFRDGLEIRKGDRVSIFARNRVEYLNTLFACNKLGTILPVINWRLKVREMDPIVNDASPRVLLYSQEFSSQIKTLRSKLTTVESFIGLDQSSGDTDLVWPEERRDWPTSQPLQVELDWERTHG